MDMLAQCACDDDERRSLEAVADELFAALADAPGAPDAFELLAMPAAFAGSPRALPTLEETTPVASLPLRRDWTAADDRHLLALFELHGARWRRIARASPSPRSDDAVRNRLFRLKQRGRPTTPPASKPRVWSEGEGTRRPWTPTEDARLRALARTSHSWLTVSRSFVGRTPHACRNRVFRLQM
jgi:hypothetical protein